MFMWRVLYGPMEVAECLRAHIMQADLLCQMCKQGSESISHVLFECGIAKHVWGVAKILLLPRGVSCTIENYMNS